MNNSLLFEKLRVGTSEIRWEGLIDLFSHSKLPTKNIHKNKDHTPCSRHGQTSEEIFYLLWEMFSYFLLSFSVYLKSYDHFIVMVGYVYIFLV